MPKPKSKPWPNPIPNPTVGQVQRLFKISSCLIECNMGDQQSLDLVSSPRSIKLQKACFRRYIECTLSWLKSVTCMCCHNQSAPLPWWVVDESLRQSLRSYADVSVGYINYSRISHLSLVNFGMATNDLYAFDMSSVGFGAA